MPKQASKRKVKAPVRKAAPKIGRKRPAVKASANSKARRKPVKAKATKARPKQRSTKQAIKARPKQPAKARPAGEPAGPQPVTPAPQALQPPPPPADAFDDRTEELSERDIVAVIEEHDVLNQLSDPTQP